MRTLFHRWAGWATKNNARHYPIDFSKPWWMVYAPHIGKILVVCLSMTIFQSLDSLFPIILGWAIERQSIGFLILCMTPYFAEEIFSWFVTRPLFTRLYSQVQGSFRFSAYEFFLSVDPIFHARRASGITIGKVRRTSDAFFYFTKTALDDFYPFVVVMITTMIMLFLSSPLLGAVVGVIFVVLGLIVALITTRVTFALEQTYNKEDDRLNKIGVEIINRASFMRTVFASDTVRGKLERRSLGLIGAEGIFFMSHRLMRGVLVFFYLLCILVVSSLLIYLINNGVFTKVYALSLLVLVLRSTKFVLKLDGYVASVVSAYRKIIDFYAYAHTYGKQTFPVFKTDRYAGVENNATCQTEDISIVLDHVTVAYLEGEPLLYDISSYISIARHEPNKLFGVIGPSGIGKTTLLSVLGGQLRPVGGRVLVNGCDLYQLNDSQRQHLVALQGQTSINLLGSLRYNLLFGLPSSVAIEDAYLIELLQTVGLWHLFESEKGLQTFVGEGGTTLSGGQRQRLNFVNLYLRAKHFKPSVILIDEPTSSLDEVSEQRITQMISELAHDSLTLVIAHRIKTLDGANKILDFCLINETKELVFHTRQELERLSPHYRQLASGLVVQEE
ncbi:MAG: Multidrug resistance ABC transporter, ATP-binding/permease protein BmrA [candidate division TM6 bacterium GW2011_GWF2_43_17]|nr:MAG: Multidrug resistance ABC transporter, ATP-binding/permease protein BmrA [candidate division TM6 bacterium GW2011_GWF2_43_17]HAU30285.1 hypothetical protein [Candidatus Dependentiae bacterium]